MALYHPLGDNEIRVLQLEASLRVEDPIKCYLLTTTLDDDGIIYEAVSYTWGSPFHTIDKLEYGPDDDRKVDSYVYKGYENVPRTMVLKVWRKPVVVTKEITSNLFDLLRRLRYSDRDRYLWVDALCINQEDKEERSRQVAIMARIYGGAMRAIAWLGEESPCGDAGVIMPLIRGLSDRHSWFARFVVLAAKYELSHDQENTTKLDNALVECFQSLSHAPERQQYHDLGLDDTLQDSQAQQRIGDAWRRDRHEHLGSSLRSFIWHRCFRFLSRTYFRRRWVLQELFQAKWITFLCGDHHVDWPDFHHGIRILEKKLTQLGTPLDLDGRLLPVWKVLQTKSFNSSDEYSRQSPGVALLYQTILHRDAQCQELLDKIYSLLGLLRQQPLIPDYKLTSLQLWKKFYSILVSEGFWKNLLHLRLAQLLQTAERMRLREEKIHRVPLPTQEESIFPSWLVNFNAVTEELWYNLDQPASHLTADRLAKEAADWGQAGTVPTDESNRLHCTLDCIGKIELYKRWSLLEGTTSEIRSETRLPQFSPGRPRQLFTPELPAPFEWRSHSTILQAGDCLCRCSSSWRHSLLILRPTPSYDISPVDGQRRQVCHLVGGVQVKWHMIDDGMLEAERLDGSFLTMVKQIQLRTGGSMRSFIIA